MVFSIFLILSFFVFITVEAFDSGDCAKVQCDHGSPVIQFPFYARELQSQHCGLPGFEISCKQNRTIIHFPAYGDLVVESISYDEKRVNLLDPKNCVHEVFLNLNLSRTPFKYYYVLKEYIYAKCSAEISTLNQITCLSGSSYHVYTVEPSFPLPASCIPLRTIRIPFSYSPYISDNTFGLGLTWESTALKNGEAKGCKPDMQMRSEIGSQKRWIDMIYYKALGIAMFIFMVVTLVFLKSSSPEICEANEEEEKQHEMEAQKLLGEYEALKPANHSKANTKILIDEFQTSSTDEKSENAFISHY